MVVIQTAHGDAIPVSYQLPSHEAVLAAVVRLDCETTVSPQLTLGTETVWRLQQRHPAAADPVADTTVPHADECRVPESWPAIRHDAAGHRRWYRYRVWPSCDTAL